MNESMVEPFEQKCWYCGSTIETTDPNKFRCDPYCDRMYNEAVRDGYKVGPETSEWWDEEHERDR